MKHKAFIQRNSATVLAIAGVVGVVATVVTTTRAAPKAIRLLNEAKERENHELTIWQKMQVAIPVYIPVILTGSATIFCILSSNILNKASQASLMSAYMLLDQSHKDYQRKLKELYGQEAHDRIIESLAIEKAEKVSHYACGVWDVIDLSVDSSNCGPTLLFYLLDALYHREYDPALPMDSNRAGDGLGLRYRFSDLKRYRYEDVEAALPETCSMLEMMIALALRCEERLLRSMKDFSERHIIFHILIFMILHRLGIRCL